jgi:Leucine-rich repeat (LRR) protein
VNRFTCLFVLLACVTPLLADEAHPPADWFRPAPFPELGFPQVDSDYWQYVRVASHEKVLGEIGASDMQRATMKQLYTDMTKAQRELTADLALEERRRRAAELQKKRVALWDKTRLLVEKTLTSKQRKRVDQIILQRHGHAVFFYPQLAPELKVTEGQKSEMRTHLKAHQERVKDGMKGPDSYRLFWNDVHGILTEKQRIIFQQLRGSALGAKPADPMKAKGPLEREADVAAALRTAHSSINMSEDGSIAEVTISSTGTDELLRQLQSLKSLRSLYVEVSDDVSDAGLKHIGRLTSLESLSLYSMKFSDHALKPLADLKNLKELSINEAGLTDKALVHIGGLRNLEVLTLSGNNISDAGLEHLRGLSKLRRLGIRNSSHQDSRMEISDEGLARLAPLRELCSLDLVGTAVTGAGLRHLSSFPHLESLFLSGPWINDDGMAHVSTCKELETLGLLYTKVGDRGFEQLGKLGRLERLDLSSRFVTEKGLAELVPLMNLKHVTLRCSDVGDEGLKHLSEIRALQRLDLYGSGEPGVQTGLNFSPAGYAHLKKMKNLQSLWITNADVSTADLKDLKWLKSLHLFMVTATAGELRELQKALPDVRVSAAWGGTSVPPLQLSRQIP